MKIIICCAAMEQRADSGKIRTRDLAGVYNDEVIYFCPWCGAGVEVEENYST